jgi:uracil-DNA glycosylase
MKPMVLERPVKAALPKDLQAPVKSLRQLAESEEGCTRCPLHLDATQAVPGEGPNRAPFMIVGEQPGDKEDLMGEPFVGPAGRVLDQALQDAGIKRNSAFLTNANAAKSGSISSEGWSGRTPLLRSASPQPAA